MVFHDEEHIFSHYVVQKLSSFLPDFRTNIVTIEND